MITIEDVHFRLSSTFHVHFLEGKLVKNYYSSLDLVSVYNYSLDGHRLKWMSYINVV